LQEKERARHEVATKIRETKIAMAQLAGVEQPGFMGLVAAVVGAGAQWGACVKLHTWMCLLLFAGYQALYAA
jgi:hypothetical protein